MNSKLLHCKEIKEWMTFSRVGAGRIDLHSERLQIRQEMLKKSIFLLHPKKKLAQCDIFSRQS